MRLMQFFRLEGILYYTHSMGEKLFSDSAIRQKVMAQSRTEKHKIGLAKFRCIGQESLQSVGRNS